MLHKLRTLFQQVMNDGDASGVSDTPSLHLAIASLLCEVASADHVEDHREARAKEHLLVNLLDISEDNARALLEKAQKQSDLSVSLFEFTTNLRSLSQEQRYDLIEAMWQVAYADGTADPIEEAIIRQVAELIYLDHSAFIRAKLSAQEATDS